MDIGSFFARAEVEEAVDRARRLAIASRNASRTVDGRIGRIMREIICLSGERFDTEQLDDIELCIVRLSKLFDKARGVK